MVPTFEVPENSNSWLEFISPPGYRVQIAVSAAQIYFLHRQDCQIEHPAEFEFQIKMNKFSVKYVP